MDDPTFDTFAPAGGEVALSQLKARTDVGRIMLVYITCGGNRFKTAAATGLSVEQVDDLAVDGDWADKLRMRNDMAGLESKTAEAINQEIQRIQALAQAQRLMEEINAVLLHLYKLPAEDKLKYLFEVKKDGTKAPTAAFYVEMSKALQTCQMAMFRASGDQLPGRPEAQSDEAIGKAAALSIANEVGKLSAMMSGKPEAKK
jgi:Zn finger protein HypA/HybF involved in hydrogenase expression